MYLLHSATSSFASSYPIAYGHIEHKQSKLVISRNFAACSGSLEIANHPHNSRERFTPAPYRKVLARLAFLPSLTLTCFQLMIFICLLVSGRAVRLFTVIHCKKIRPKHLRTLYMEENYPCLSLLRFIAFNPPYLTRDLM